MRPRKRRAGRPLTAPVLLFAAVTVTAAAYVACAVAALAGRTHSARCTVAAGRSPASLNIEPAAIRMPVQRRPGTQERVDLAYLWPSLLPPDPARKPTVGAPVDPNERLFVTIQTGDGTLPLCSNACRRSIRAIWWPSRSPVP